MEIYVSCVDAFYLWDGKTSVLIYFELLKSWTGNRVPFLVTPNHSPKISAW